MRVSEEAPRRGPLDSTSGFSAVSSTSRRSNLVSGSLASLQQGAKFMWRKKWLIPVLHSQFWFSACFSLMAPFFPSLADQKGIPQTTYGWIFSIFKLFMFIGSFGSEKLIDRFGPVPLYVAGLIGTFLFDICIGSLYWVDDANIFLGLSFPLAIAGGFLACSYSVSMYSMVTERFSEKPGLIIASMEFLWGTGNMVGSMVGGFLIEFWGFPFPFFALGVIMVLLIPTIIRNGPLQPSKNQSQKDLASRPSSASLGRQSRVSVMSSVSSQPGQPVNYKYMILQPLFIIDMITVMCSWIVMSFNEPTLQPWLSKQFRLTESGIGIVFCVQYACYATGALLSGFVSSFGHEEFLLFLGQLCAALAYLLIGPVPFINKEPSMGFIYLSQVFTGFGMAAQFVCGFAHALKISIRAGYPKNIKTSGVVASATFVFMVLGAIVTPPIASFVVEEFGYRQGTMFIFCPLAAWSLVNLGVFIYGLKNVYTRSADNDEAFA